jgi:hypothetical protein
MFKDNTPILLTRQLHLADRAGRHYDIRLVLGDKAYSWATRKDMPAVGEAIALYEQPVHTAEYAMRRRIVIPRGNYGSGITTLDFVRKALATNSDGGKDKFVLTVPESGERYLFKKFGGQNGNTWMLKNLGERKIEETPVTNKYLEKIASFRPKKNNEPNGKFEDRAGFKSRFAEMFDASVKSRKMNKDKVKNYKWGKAVGIANKDGHLVKLMVPSKTEPGKHFTLKHPDYKGK